MQFFTYTATFAIVNSATCASKGFHIISSKNECEDAAISLGLSDTYAYEYAATSNPTGCIVNPNSGWLAWNTNANDVTCGSVYSGIGYTYNCICKGGKFKHFGELLQS